MLACPCFSAGCTQKPGSRRRVSVNACSWEISLDDGARWLVWQLGSGAAFCGSCESFPVLYNSSPVVDFVCFAFFALTLIERNGHENVFLTSAEIRAVTVLLRKGSTSVLLADSRVPSGEGCGVRTRGNECPARVCGGPWSRTPGSEHTAFLTPYPVMIYNFTRVWGPSPSQATSHLPGRQRRSSCGRVSLCSSPGPCLEAPGRRVGRAWMFQGRLPTQPGRQQAARVPVCLGDFAEPELSAQGELGRPWESGGPRRAGHRPSATEAGVPPLAPWVPPPAPRMRRTPWLNGRTVSVFKQIHRQFLLQLHDGR